MTAISVSSCAVTPARDPGCGSTPASSRRWPQAHPSSGVWSICAGAMRSTARPWTACRGRSSVAGFRERDPRVARSIGAVASAFRQGELRRDCPGRPASSARRSRLPVHPSDPSRPGPILVLRSGPRPGSLRYFPSRWWPSPPAEGGDRRGALGSPAAVLAWLRASSIPQSPDSSAAAREPLRADSAPPPILAIAAEESTDFRARRPRSGPCLAATGHFHTALCAGETVAAAVSQAQHRIRQRAETRHPFFWAGFVVIGKGAIRIPLEHRSALPGWLPVLGSAVLITALALGVRRIRRRSRTRWSTHLPHRSLLRRATTACGSCGRLGAAVAHIHWQRFSPDSTLRRWSESQQVAARERCHQEELWQRRQPMTLLTTTDPAKAEGLMKQVFDAFEQELGTVPGPLLLFTASPKAWHVYLQYVDFIRTHPTLPMPLTTCLRYIISKRSGFRACTEFNAMLLDRQGVSVETREAMVEDPQKAPLEERERALLGFVVSAAAAPTPADTPQDAAGLERLRGLGWSDAEIFDATWHGINMLTLARLMQCFGGGRSGRDLTEERTRRP
ncbi:MAG: CHAT domain-containing protein [Candidatus Eisenbacteria bacterium]|nr:CHAT domain-containing protein [Candidatus Eisenbacteria bacterium]